MVTLLVVLAVVAVAAVTVAALSVVRLADARRRLAAGTPPAAGNQPDPAGDAAGVPAETLLAPGAGGHEDEAGDDHGARLEGLWSLELLRSARTWAVYAPGAEPPPRTPADPGAELVTALQLELERLREEAGLPGELRVDAVPRLSAGDALVLLRLATEALAAAARVADAVDVAVVAAPAAGETGVQITLDGAAEGAGQATLDVLALLGERVGAVVTGEEHTFLVSLAPRNMHS